MTAVAERDQIMGKIPEGTEDALGSVRLVTDSTGAVVARFDHGSWGELLSSSFDNVPNGGMPYRFVGTLGVRYDADLGLYYMRNRWYDPSLNRFISRDPIGLSGGAHLYAYVKDNPLRKVDPSGLWSMTPKLESELQPVAMRSGYSSAADFLQDCITKVYLTYESVLFTNMQSSQHQENVRNMMMDMMNILNSKLSFGYTTLDLPGAVTLRPGPGRWNEAEMTIDEISEDKIESATINFSESFIKDCKREGIDFCIQTIQHELYHVYRGRLWKASHGASRDRYLGDYDHGPDMEWYFRLIGNPQRFF